jgi:catechol 2,3-dioxygenase-like lactoylglutathione lyase family enzyme
MLECRHLMINVSDLAEARRFYVDMLSLPLLEEHPTMFALRAGQVRFSVVGGGRKLPSDTDEVEPVTLMLATENIEQTVADLREKGAEFLGEIVEAPGFMKHIALADPDNNLIYIGEYLRDPLAAA